MATFSNNDRVLLARVERTLATRKQYGLEGLTGGLEAVIINVEPAQLRATVEEYLRYTGYDFATAFEDDDAVTCVLALPGAADILLRTRKRGGNPFRSFNRGPKTVSQQDARLETLVFKAHDLEKYLSGQQQRGQLFLNPSPLVTANYAFIQSRPSRFTGNSVGLVEWRGGRDWSTPRCRPLDWSFAKPNLPHLKNIGFLDHAATRVRAEERDDAIIEFMGLTDYNFVFAVYVESLNSITNVARLCAGDYAQVFTSGIEPFSTPETSGPTEMFIHNFGLRVHHLAFATAEIDATYAALIADGMEFLVELVGSREEGLQQTFTKPSPRTYLVNEYIQRYDGFEGFFTKSNVRVLTASTGKQ